MGRLNAIHPDEPHTILKVRGIPVSVNGVYQDGAGVTWVSVQTIDGSHPFMEQCSKPPYWALSNGTTVKITDINPCFE